MDAAGVGGVVNPPNVSTTTSTAAPAQHVTVSAAQLLQSAPVVSATPAFPPTSSAQILPSHVAPPASQPAAAIQPQQYDVSGQPITQSTFQAQFSNPPQAVAEGVAAQPAAVGEEAVPVVAAAEEYPAEKRITIWNKLERRKISGNAAPMGKNLHAYLSKHPECEVFNGQDKNDPIPMAFGPPGAGPFSVYGGGETLLAQIHEQQVQQEQFLYAQADMAHMAAKAEFADSTEKRITIWHKTEKRKISGNAAPMEKNLHSYLSTHPECEVYTNQDKAEGEGGQDESQPLNIRSDPNAPAHFEDANLTPVGSFGFENDVKDNEKSMGMAMRSPGYPQAHEGGDMDMDMAMSPMSPVDSLADSFQTMDFSLGSSYGSRGGWPRSRGMSGADPNMGGGGYDLLRPELANAQRKRTNSAANRKESDTNMEGRDRSNTADDYGVMGKLEDF